MKGPELDRMTASAIAADISAGTRTANEVAEAVLSVIDAREAEIQALEYFDPNLIRQQASQIDAGSRKGPLSGVTVAVKDIINTKDTPTACGTPRYKDVYRGADAACVDMLRGAGALIIGKAVTAEFAATNRGPKTRNPHDAERTAGGSSTGSAVAVAAGYCALGVGTQTGGSIVRPASYNGVFGWKPTWGVIPVDGTRVLAPTCDTIGFFARDAADFALLADVFGLDPAPLANELRGLKVGVCHTPNWPRAEEATHAALDSAIACFRSAGADVATITLPARFEEVQHAQSVIMARELGTTYLNEVYNTPDLHADFSRWVEKGRSFPADVARNAYAVADECRAAIDGIIAGYDIVLAPSATGEAPLGVDYTGDSSLNSMWTLLQLPVVSVPGLYGPNGMPVGVSLVARRYHDRTAISVARLLAPLLAASARQYRR